LKFLEEFLAKKNRIPFILFTGKGREEVAIKALNLGVMGYFNKQGHPETVYGELAHGIKIAVENNKTKEELKEKIKAINEKLRVVGSLTRHDVSNKLSVIKANTYLLKRKLSDETELTKYLTNIDLSIESASRLFDFSPLYERIGAEEHANIEVKNCFDEAVALFPNLGQISVKNKSDGLILEADSLLRQVFYNLIENSLKHGQKVTQIYLHQIKHENETKLIYEDDGVGIPENNKPKLFNEGFSTSKGTGLGLAIIRKILQVHGWKINEKGEPGKGVKFVISIPSHEVSI
jgi:signal transduction histidine kinase